MKVFIFLVTVPLIVVILGCIIIRERNIRKKTEQELEDLKKSLEELCETCIKENNRVHARITHEAYFGRPVDHTGDGFIAGYE